jgi:hypothetical protein
VSDNRAQERLRAGRIAAGDWLNLVWATGHRYVS